MGRLFLVEYDQTPDTQFYSCRACRTPIALADQLLYQDESERRPVRVFNNVVNVIIDDPARYEEVACGGIVAGVYCTKCNIPLGRKIVKLPKYTTKVAEGNVTMNMTKLLLWDGHQFLNAHTLQLAENI
ncbi:uncharacterized protein LOC131149567 [Malania oleifera]|uniref:uncharacterized protein LOC131149567 n=1 Tax=Malania oleifera TaxID=397392 RepID=UPI0025AE79A5|nr:uncharacterized protein LOC131149567 [Malania oleifera]